jgi:hypothetical protein
MALNLFMNMTTPKETREKIRIYGADYKKDLAEDIDIDLLPDFLGGKQKINIESGTWAEINPGPWNDP